MIVQNQKKPNTIKVDILKINLDEEIYPRVGIDEQLVETYRLHLEAGIELPPLVVQKETFTLVDGAHRFHAAKKLKVDTVEVEIVNIVDSELRAEAIRRNIKHGKRFTLGEIRATIISLRFKDKKSQREIAQIVNLSESRISQILMQYRHGARQFFSDLNPKVPKIDLRVKADLDTKTEILEEVATGLSGKEIAEKHKISQGLVSQIKKKNQDWLTSPVYFKIEKRAAVLLLAVAFVNKQLSQAKFEFKENGITIRNCKGEKETPLCIASFDVDCFLNYRLSHPIDGYAKSDLLKQVKDIDSVEIEFALLDANTWKLRWANNERTHRYDDIDWRDFPVPHLELDSDGIPKSVATKLQVVQNDFPIKSNGQLTFKMEEGELVGVYECEKWKCQRTIEPKFIEKKGNARAYVDLATIDKLLKISFLRNDCFWIGMWSDRTHLAIGKSHPNYRACFIL